MPITALQRARRRHRIGSSDSPAILGVDPWRTAYDVFLEKTFQMKDAESPAIDLGNLLEEPMVRWAADQLGVEVELNVPVDAGDGIFAANLDARAVGRREAIEAKSTSNPAEWGKEGTDQAPDRTIVQTQHQMMVADLDAVWVPVLLSRFDRLQPTLYRVDRHEDVIEAIREQGSAFWSDHVRAKLPPSGVRASEDTLRRIRRVPKVMAEVGADLVKALEDAKAARKKAEEVEREAKVALLAAMGEAEGADYGDPKWVYTFLKQTRVGLDVKRLRADHPAIAQTYATVTTFPVLRRKKRK